MTTMSPLVTSVLLLIGLSAFGFTMFGRVRAMLALKAPANNRLDRIPERIAALMKFGMGQKRMINPEEFVPGLMHVFIFGAFMVLSVRTIMMFVMGYSETVTLVLGNLHASFWSEHQLLLGAYSGFLVVKDLAATAAVVGVLYFMFLRLKVKPDRLTKSREAILILGFIGTLMVTEFIFGASHLREQGVDISMVEPVTTLVAMILGPLPDNVLLYLGAASFWIHLSVILVFLNFLPYGKHFHVIVGLPNVFLLSLPPDQTRPIASSAKLSTPNLEQEEFGVKNFKDLSWKDALDVNACTCTGPRSARPFVPRSPREVD